MGKKFIGKNLINFCWDKIGRRRNKLVVKIGQNVEKRRILPDFYKSSKVQFSEEKNLIDC